MNDLLQQLKDIHTPPAIATWPIAPGWWVIYAILVLILFRCILFLRRYFKRKYPVKYALKKLAKLERHRNAATISIEISALIRRTALYYYDRQSIAGLSGADWLAFLNKTGETEIFKGKAGDLLINAPYQKNSPADISVLIDSTRQWLKTISKNVGGFRSCLLLPGLSFLHCYLYPGW